MAQTETLGFSDLSMRGNLSDVGPNSDSSLRKPRKGDRERVLIRPISDRI